jgi:Pyruvate/2-oxoacid:ferredoxin oxidoreductase delta subunit
MSQEVYKQLLEVMKKRGGKYAGMDIPEFFSMVEELFTPQEAEVNNAMPRGFFAAKALAITMGRDENEIEAILEAMADKGLCLTLDMEQKRVYQASRFMVGILEYQFMSGKTTDRDKKLAQLIYSYEKAFDQKMNNQTVMSFPTTRVITVDALVQVDNQVHTYDQIQTYIDQSDQIAVTTCYCRHAAFLRGEDIHGMPNDVCMQFGHGAQFAVDRLGARKVSKQEAREVLNRAEEAGLIHMSQNMTEDISFLCNCDRWHCGAVLSALAKPKPGLFFNSGFEPRFDPDLCSACGVCIERCPPAALTLGDDGPPQVNLERCFGCAVCATGCPSQAISMVNKPGFPPPPPKNAKAFMEALNASHI